MSQNNVLKLNLGRSPLSNPISICLHIFSCNYIYLYLYRQIKTCQLWINLCVPEVDGPKGVTTLLKRTFACRSFYTLMLNQHLLQQNGLAYTSSFVITELMSDFIFCRISKRPQQTCLASQFSFLSCCQLPRVWNVFILQYIQVWTQ